MAQNRIVSIALSDDSTRLTKPLTTTNTFYTWPPVASGTSSHVITVGTKSTIAFTTRHSTTPSAPTVQFGKFGSIATCNTLHGYDKFNGGYQHSARVSFSYACLLTTSDTTMTQNGIVW
jgi:hypothetical protein